MSNSDSDEFYDLEESDGGKDSLSNKSLFVDESVFYSPNSTLHPSNIPEKLEMIKQPATENKDSDKTFKEPVKPRPTNFGDSDKKYFGPAPVGNIEKRRQKLEELRKHMLKDEEDGVNVGSPPGSRTSSVDGVYAANKPSHPFRVVDHDAVSLQSTVSLGRVGRILGGEQKAVSMTNSKENVSRAPTPEVKSTKESQAVAIVVSEPDIVASTKPVIEAENTVVAVGLAVAGVVVRAATFSEPVAPPRRKRKPKASTSDAASICSQQDSPVVEMLPSPATTVEFLTKELEYSLDLKSASRGQFVVKPQDDEKTRGEGSSSSPELSSASNKTNEIPVKEETISSVPGASPSHEEMVSCQLNMFVRTRTDSGKPLTDLEILEQVTVKNLDTGEHVPLSVAEDKLPRCINPLSLHIMRLTSEYVSNTSLDKHKESDEESVDLRKVSTDQASEGDTVSLRKKTSQLKRFLGSTVKKTVDKAKMIAHEVSHARHKEEIIDIPDELTGGEQHVKMKASSSHKGPYDFDTLQCVQEITGEHVGPIWCMKFSPCGRLLATAGQDRILRIWVLKAAFSYFQDMRSRYNADSKASPTPSQESLVSQHSSEDAAAMATEAETDPRSPFVSRPFCVYAAHTSDLLDVAWSKNYFILSSSMDKTVRLWHISRKECLCCFQHIDFVTAIAFHPRDDRYFLSGSLDGKLRLWNIPDKKVALWNELDGQTKLITAANFCQNGKFAVVGSYDGRCIFYTTEQLKYHTQIHVRSTRGKNSKGRKITGIEPMPNEDKILVTSNDSRIRLYDLRDLNLSCKYRGYVNNSSQIRASFSHDGKYIVSGSENQYIYKWKTHHDYAKFASARRDRNDYWEAIKAHNAVVTSVIFAPDPNFVIAHMEKDKRAREDEEPAAEPQSRGRGSIPKRQAPLDVAGSASLQGYVLVSADFNGMVKVFVNRVKPKHSSLPVSALA